MLWLLTIPLLLFAVAVAAQERVDYSKYVNPFIGSEGPFEGLAFGVSLLTNNSSPTLIPC